MRSSYADVDEQPILRRDIPSLREVSAMVSAVTNPYAPPRATVLDIPSLGALSLAGRGTRLGAALLDGVFMMLIGVPIFIGGLLSGGSDDKTMLVVGGVLGLTAFIVWAWFTIRLLMANGQTIAKKLLGIKIIRTDGSAASFSRILWLRGFVNGLIGIVPFYGLIDLLFIFSEERQCLHDKLADTMVVEA
jgi:uncharacterized RDD family membrane protein YckC